MKVIIRIISKFSFMVFLATVLGLLTGGYPSYTNEIAIISMIVAMTLSLSPISLKAITKGENLKFAVYSLLLNFGLLSGFSIAIGFLFKEELRFGFMMMASVPTAVAVIPITKILKSRVELAFVSSSLIYLSSFLITPTYILLLLGKEINMLNLFRDIILLIFLPLVASRFIRKIKLSEETSRIISNICFFLLIFGIMGKNRSFLFCESKNLFLLSIVLAVRSFGIGSLVFETGRKFGIQKDKILPLSLFSVFKNQGVAILLCLSLLPKDISYISTVPCVLAIIFEMGWAGYLETRIKRW